MGQMAASPKAQRPEFRPRNPAWREAARKLLRFATSVESAVLMAKNTGSVPANQGAIDDARQAPPLSFIVHAREQEHLPGERLCGALVHRLHRDRAETDLLAPRSMETPSLDDVRAETHPREPEPAAS
jgi:hypothetical protein